MCITNTVAENFSANCLLAVGARPAMIHQIDEAEELVKVSSGVLINVGTVDEKQEEICRVVALICKREMIPWVLDPVAVHLLSFRRELVFELIKSKPTIIRGNEEEIDFLKRVNRFDGVMLSTGAVDVVSDGKKELKIAGGVEMLQMVTATGCAQGAIIAAMLGRGMSALEAAEKASRLMKKAGEMAYEKAKTPGAFKTALIDSIWTLSK